MSNGDIVHITCIDLLCTALKIANVFEFHSVSRPKNKSFSKKDRDIFVFYVIFAIIQESRERERGSGTAADQSMKLRSQLHHRQGKSQPETEINLTGVL